MGYTDGSRCGDKVSHGALPARASRGRIRERGGDSLGGEGMRTTVSPKEEKKRGKGGVQYGNEGVGSSADRVPRKRGSVHYTRMASAALCRDHAITGC